MDAAAKEKKREKRKPGKYSDFDCGGETHVFEHNYLKLNHKFIELILSQGLKGHCRCERWGYIGFFGGAESENVTDF